MNIEPEEKIEPADIEQEVSAAFDKAIEENPSDPAAVVAEVEPVAAESTDEVAEKVEAVADDKAEPVKVEPVDAEKEIATLGLKGRSAERFQHMANEIKTYAPIKEALDKAGVTDIAELPRMLERANVADQWEEAVISTNSTPEQVGMAFDYLRFANQALGGDLKAAEKCYEYMAEEMKTWGAMLGKEVTGVVDPMEGDADLKEAVENGEITRAYALQIAASRTQNGMATQRDEQTRQVQENQTLFESGTRSLNELGDVLVKADQHYDAKLQYFLPMVKTIRETCHPSEWAKRSRDAYLQIPDPVVQARPAPTPIRPSGLAPGLTPVLDDPVEAFDLGMQSVM